MKYILWETLNLVKEIDMGDSSWYGQNLRIVLSTECFGKACVSYRLQAGWHHSRLPRLEWIWQMRMSLPDKYSRWENVQLGREHCGSKADSERMWWYNQATVRSPECHEGGEQEIGSWRSSLLQDVKAAGTYWSVSVKSRT